MQRHIKCSGIRHPIEAEPDDTWMIRPDVLAGLAELEHRDFPFDLVIFPCHLKYVPILREQCPELTLVLDHLCQTSYCSWKDRGNGPSTWRP
jgi:L-fuconolactonase